MNWRDTFARITKSATWMTIGFCVSLVMLTWYTYHGIHEWQRSSAQLATRRAADSADLLITALTRDMRGVQDSVLMSERGDQFRSDAPYELSDLIASAFARYPYPESFFAWREHAPAPMGIWFFNRSDRRPSWMRTDETPKRFPVTISNDTEVGREFLNRISQDAASGRPFSVFEKRLAGTNYQVVARLVYRDPFRERLDGIFGFTVNLDWIRKHYFPDLTKQVAHIGTGSAGLDLAIRDDANQLVTSTHPDVRVAFANQRLFALLFCDPGLVALQQAPDLPKRLWAVEVAVANDPTLAAAMNGANRTLIVSALAVVSLAASLLFMGRAVRTSAKLVEMRSDFISTVTHELKTPIATIRAAGDTLASGRITSAETAREYAHIVVQEAKRLTRLVDNLLAYARVTDVANVYSFEPLSVDQLVGDVLERFHPQLDSAHFSVAVDMPDKLLLIRADRTAVDLLLDNLIDNAIRYSGVRHQVTVAAYSDGNSVLLKITDCGTGIPPDEIGRVARKFVRGRLAGSGGSGLGLAIASRIARDHGGVLSIESRLHEGTCVTVRLPTPSVSHEEKTHFDS